MASFTWSINELTYEVGPDSEGHTDIVVSIDWLVTASDGEDPPHEAKWAGIVKVTWEEGDDWIPYDEISEEQAVEWVQEELGPEEITRMETSLDAQLAELENPTKVIARSGDLPWNEGD